MEKNRNKLVFQCWWSRGEGVTMTIQRIVLNVARGICCTSFSFCAIQWTSPTDQSGLWEMALKCNFGVSLLIKTGWLWRVQWACSGPAGQGGSGGGHLTTYYITSLLFLMAQHRTILKIIPMIITPAIPIPVYPMMCSLSLKKSVIAVRQSWVSSGASVHRGAELSGVEPPQQFRVLW